MGLGEYWKVPAAIAEMTPPSTGIIVNAHDITEFKLAENELHHMVERWSIVYHAGEEIGAGLDIEHIFRAVHRVVLSRSLWWLLYKCARWFR